MGGDAPEGFLANGENTVDDVRNKAALMLQNLSNYQRNHGLAAGKVGSFLLKAVSGEIESHEIRCFHQRPIKVQKLLGIRYRSCLIFGFPERTGRGIGKKSAGKIKIMDVVFIEPFIEHKKRSFFHKWAYTCYNTEK